MSRGKTAAWRALESVDMSKTVSSVVSATTAALRRAGIPEPELSVEHLMAETLAGSDGSRNRVGTLALAHDRALTDTETAAFDSMITKRLDRMPIQMILGSWDFHNITLKVQPGILCPRPETELLVDLALAGLSSHASPRVVDVGAGTGAIGLAILNEHQHATCDAIDIDPAAVMLSLSNASSLGVADRYSCRADGIGPFARWHSASRSPPYDMLGVFRLPLTPDPPMSLQPAPG
jgi:release factor glutamine methyltransferase